ncbi:hypothetical protein [Synechococcus sp. M16CYN]
MQPFALPCCLQACVGLETGDAVSVVGSRSRAHATQKSVVQPSG